MIPLFFNSFRKPISPHLYTQHILLGKDVIFPAISCVGNEDLTRSIFCHLHYDVHVKSKLPNDNKFSVCYDCNCIRLMGWCWKAPTRRPFETWRLWKSTGSLKSLYMRPSYTLMNFVRWEMVMRSTAYVSALRLQRKMLLREPCCLLLLCTGILVALRIWDELKTLLPGVLPISPLVHKNLFLLVILVGMENRGQDRSLSLRAQ